MNSKHEPLLEVQNLAIQFSGETGPTRAVDGISFSIGRGETVAVVGESGSGKTVTSLAIMRLLPFPPARIVAGTILFKGQDLLALDEREMRRIRGNDIAMIFQEPMTALNPVHTIGHQVAEAIMAHQNKNRARAWSSAVEMLRVVDIPDPEKRAACYPHELSGGQRQRAMIAMALSCRPSLIIADEPTASLDVIVQDQILRLIKRLKQEIGASTLFITHDLGVVAEIADRVVVMQKGRIVEQGDSRGIFEDPQHPYTQRLLAAVPRIRTAMPARVPLRRASVMVEVRNLNKWYPDNTVFSQRAGNPIKAVKNVSLDIRRGEVVGLVGESGSGKTTVGRTILRLIEPTSGSIRLDDVDIRGLTTRQLRSFRRRMQIIFQDPYGSLNPRKTIGDILAEPLAIHGLHRGRRERRRRIEQLLELVQLEPAWVSRFPHEFSGGQRQRIGIARAIAVEPDFLVADECVSALDVSIRREVLNLIKDLRRRLGLTILFVSHDLAVVEDIADEVAVMYRGELVEFGSAESIYRRPQDDYTRALLSAIPVPDPSVSRPPVTWDAETYQTKRAARA